MIDFRLAVRNPLSPTPFKNLWLRTAVVSKNKILEIRAFRSGCNLFELEIDTSFTGYDRAGPSIELGFLTWYISVNLRDNRRWDHDSNTWDSD